MGTDKAGLLWNGQSLLAQAVHVVQSVTGSATIVGDPAVHRINSIPVIADRVRGAGALAGIEAALDSSATPWTLIVACDMPTLDPEVLNAIVERALAQPECDAVIPTCGRRPQPLCAAYHRSARPAVHAALEAGTFKIMDALESGAVRVAYVEIAVETAFRNVNTPEDWNAFLSEKSA